ncbi:MAG: ATP-binding protein [Nitrospinota bacterium]
MARSIPFYNRTSFRLMLVFVTLTLLFASVAAWVFFNDLQKFDKAMIEFNNTKDAMAAALNMDIYIQKKHEHQVHVLLGSIEHVERVEAMRDLPQDWLEVIEAFSLSGEEISWYEALEKLDKQSDRVFFEEIVPAVVSNDREKIRLAHDKHSEIFEKLRRLSYQYQRSFKGKLATVQEKAHRLRQRAIIETVAFVSLAVVLTMVVGVATHRYIAHPIEALIEETDHIARGELERPIPVTRRDEFGRLAAHFNRMVSELRQHQEQLLHAERLATLGRLSASVAHEVNNPLGVILGYTKVLMKDRRPGDPDYEGLKTIEEEARQCQTFVTNLLSLARPSTSVMEAQDVRPLIEEVFQRMEKLPRTEGVKLGYTLPPHPLMVLADQDKLREVLFNLLVNALEAVDGRGMVHLAAEAGAEPPTVRIAISDTGPGVPPEVRDRLFEPFVTTKKDSTGLGLAISRGIIEAHGGTIELASVPGQETTFLVTLPRLKDGAAGWA